MFHRSATTQGTTRVNKQKKKWKREKCKTSLCSCVVIWSLYCMLLCDSFLAHAWDDRPHKREGLRLARPNPAFGPSQVYDHFTACNRNCAPCSHPPEANPWEGQHSSDTYATDEAKKWIHKLGGNKNNKQNNFENKMEEQKQNEMQKQTKTSFV